MRKVIDLLVAEAAVTTVEKAEAENQPAEIESEE
jgi:hypothetical protein